MSTKSRPQFQARTPNLSTQTPIIQTQESIVQTRQPDIETREATPPTPAAPENADTVFPDEQTVDVTAIRIAFRRLEKLTLQALNPSKEPERILKEAFRRELPGILRLIQNALPEEEAA